MEVKSQKTLIVSLVAFLTLVITLSLCFADKLPQDNSATYEANGGYLFTFNLKCVDENGNLLKTATMTGNGTNWSFSPPAIEGYSTTSSLITRNDIKDWSFPASNYIREATGTCVLTYTLVD